jgi:hypothetical protein
MRRPLKDPSSKLTADSQRLISLSQALAQAGSRLEERNWEASLDVLVEKLLINDRQSALDSAFEHIFKTEPATYDTLMESVEAVSESCTVEQDSISYDALLIALPMLAWTRFSIASGPVATDTLLTLSAHLYAHVLAADTKLALAPNLFSIDQLPRTHAETFSLTRRLTQAALTGGALRPLVNPPETAPFLADTRYLLAVVAAPVGAPLFRWQASEVGDIVGEREQALAHWRAQAMPTIERMLPGCGVELLLPEAYYVACREADKQIRPASIRAAVHFLTHALGVEPSGLSAIIGGFADQLADGSIEEYRISFTLYQQRDVVYGVVWPLYTAEEVEADLSAVRLSSPIDAGIAPQADGENALKKIRSLLAASGVTDVKFHAEQFPMESCDDCGAPLYCDHDAELVHAEMPEDVPQTTEHFH